MTYTTLTYLGVEKSMADWGVGSWSRATQNQANDEFVLTIPTPMDGPEIFPYGANIIIKINRAASATNPVNPTLPVSVALIPSVTYSGGAQWFWGYCVDNNRAGQPNAECFEYKFAGPYQFFFERLIFQKLQLTWNGAKQIADYQSDVILGLSLTTLTGTGDTVQGTTATNLMSIAQQVKEICLYAQADSAYQQASNGLGWPGTVQFQCDPLTAAIDGINWDLLQNPSANVLITDYAGAPLAGKTSASALPSGSYMLRCPLDAVNAITCADAMRRQLQWIGGIGSPVVWTDHSQTPPQLHIATRDQLGTKSLALSGVTVKNNIKKRADLIPAAVHFKYKVAGTFLGQPYSVVINDVAAYVGGALVEGIGQLGALTGLNGAALSSGNQTALMAAAKTATAVVQTFDFQGDQVNAASCKITTASISSALANAGDPMWTYLFPALKNVTNLAFYNTGNPGVTIKDAVNGTVYYQNGAWTGTAYSNVVQDGQVAPWMLAGTSPTNPAGGKTVQALITARFYYVQKSQGPSGETAPQGVKDYHEKNITVTLTTLGSGTYYSSPDVAVGEPLPYGLAGYILAIENIPQHEGSVLVQETEISDLCPLGNALNITGGLAEWTAMKACVQSVRYSDNGQTEIIFGPARHLGPAQFVARFRSNIGPRWYTLIAGDPMNQSNPGAAELGNNIPKQSPDAGGHNWRLQHHLAQLPTQQGSNATLPQGVHLDSGDWFYNTGVDPYPFGTGAVPSGVAAFGKGPQLIVAGGPTTGTSNDGEAQAWIRISIADLLGSKKQIYLQEIPVCVNVNGLMTPMYQLFLCSQPYANSIG